MLVEGVSLEDYDEFHAFLLLGRKSVVDVQEWVVLLMSAGTLSDVENEIASFQLQHFLPTAVAT